MFPGEGFNSVPRLQQKMATYLLWFNFLRKNSYKENQTQLQIALTKNPEINSELKLNVGVDHHVGGTSLFLPSSESPLQ
jgi:hypothetical protein